MLLESKKYTPFSIKIIRILIVTVFCYMSVTILYNNNNSAIVDISGTWAGQINDTYFTISFMGDSNFTMIIQDETVEELNGKYSIDESKSPTTLSLTAIDRGITSQHTIIRLTNHNSIEFAPFAPRWLIRPIGFPVTSLGSLFKIKNNKE